jgi:hypothetical protein
LQYAVAVALKPSFDSLSYASVWPFYRYDELRLDGCVGATRFKQNSGRSH